MKFATSCLAVLGWLAVTCLPTLVFAQPLPGGQGIDLTGIGLTSEQRTRIEALRREDQQKIAEVRSRIKAETQKLQELLQADASDDQLHSQYEQFAQRRQQMERLRFENLLRIRAVLTSEQRSQIRFRFGRRGGRLQEPTPEARP